MTNSLISLVITVFNREQFLAIAIDSILTQSYAHFELMIWDDGSSDHSPSIAEAYAQRDSPIRSISAKHQGRGYALDFPYENKASDPLQSI